jgi:hypothetical protein
MEAIYFPETSVGSQRTTRCYISENGTLLLTVTAAMYETSRNIQFLCEELMIKERDGRIQKTPLMHFPCTKRRELCSGLTYTIRGGSRLGRVT